MLQLLIPSFQSLSVTRLSMRVSSLVLIIVSLVSPAFGDDFAKLKDIFTSSVERAGLVTIPPGDYELDGTKPLPLASHMTVTAYGARFHLPTKLGDKARVVLFAGNNVSDFRWFGGHFSGNVFDPSQPANSWEPNANTRAILITTSASERTENLTFRDITSDGVAGAVITVLGGEKKGSDREIETYARNVTIENCTLTRSGKFMWDYGYLWQITVWPEDYTPDDRAMAAKYFRNDLIRGPVRMEANDDRVFVENSKPLPVSPVREGADADRGHDSICFFGDTLPTNVVRGRQYFVIESSPQFIRIADTPNGESIRFKSTAGPQTKLISHLFQAHLALYAPTGSGPGKGALDLVGCEKVIVRGCRLSALGDTMHIQKSRSISFSGNHITGSRMGAFFLAEFCQDATITGNTVDGTNGSRVISVEKSCQDVVIVGNTFRNGGRGSWINQPRNFVLADNVFVNNTTKCERDPRRGRRSFLTGNYESYAELYFTTHEPGGRYENVTVRGNIFTSGPHATHAITFAPGGDTLLVTDNIFRGSARTIGPLNGCEKVTIRDNAGIESPETRCENRRIRVHVPSAAKGFVMHAPDVKLEDVGTEFAMNVKAQKNAVHLYDGEVIAHTKDKAPESLKVGMSLASTTAGVSPQDFFPNNDLEGLIQQREQLRFQQWQTWSQEIRKDLPLIADDSFLHAPDDRWDRLISNFADPQEKQRTSGAVGAQWTQGRWQSIAVSYDNQSGRVLQYFDGFEISREVSKNPHHLGPLRDRQSESAHGKSSLLFSHPQWKRRDRSVHHLQRDAQRCGDPIRL